MADELRIRLFGGLEVEGIAAKDLGSRKARTLVEVLALARGAVVPAERIADALWPADPPARPTEQIGVLVSRLRAVLGSERFIRTDAGWSLAVDWLDADELETRVDEAAARMAAGSPAAALAVARAALELVRGDLVADEPDAPWAEADRAGAARAVARARVIIAEAALATGHPPDAAAAAERALDHDPYDEQALRVLMRAHAAAGRPASALAAYARVRERLVEDLGVSPVEETEALHTAILLGRIDTPGGAERRAARSRRVVGRDRELAALDRALASAVAGQSNLVVVEGEAGIGKTALVDEWTERVSARALVLAGRCDELGRDLPLQPILDGVAVQLRRLPEPDAAAVLGDSAEVLGPLLGRVPDAGATRGPTTVNDPAAGRAMLFARLLAAIERAAGPRPCVVVVEDIHFASPSTLEWLQFAVRRSDRLLAVASRRLGEGTALQGAAVVRLGPLDLDAVADLVGAERAPELHARSGGHPLFLVELAAADDSGALPDSVRDAVVSRVEALGDAATTLRAAAVLGTTIDIDVLAGVLDRPLPVLLEHLEAGMRAHVVAEREGSLVFRHDLLREALAADTTVARRAYLHRQAARVLRDRPRHDPLEVAWHAQRGGDAESAAGALVDAAAIARDRFDVAAADDLLGQALALYETPAAYLDRARVRIARWELDGARDDARRAIELGAGVEGLEVAAWVEYYRRDYDLAYRYAEEAVARSSEPGLRASCLAMSGRVLHARGDLLAAEPRLQEAVREAPPAVRGFAQVWLAGLRMHQGRGEEANELVDRALVEHEWLGHPFARNHGWHFRMLALGHLGRPAEALVAAKDARDLALAGGESGTRFVAVADNVRSWVLRALGRVDEGDELSASVEEWTAEGQPTAATNEMRCAALLDLAEGPLLKGDLDAAAAAIERGRVVETINGTMMWHHRQRHRVQEARWLLGTGAFAEAFQLATAVVGDAVARGTPRYGALASAVAARASLAMGEPVDRGALDAVLAELDRCAGLEAWLVTAELASAARDEAWWRDAERRAGRLIGLAGDDAETLRSWVASQFSALGRR